jgi:hypothetical protein
MHDCLPPTPAPLQPIEFILSASVGSLLVVAIAIVRIFLGWQYVGNRLLSAAVEYEETGWCAAPRARRAAGAALLHARPGPPGCQASPGARRRQRRPGPQPLHTRPPRPPPQEFHSFMKAIGASI